MTPLADDLSVLQQQQPGIGTDDGFQRCLIGIAERVFCSRDIAPVIDALSRTCRQSIERIAVVEAVFLHLIQLVELGIVGLFQMGRYQ